MRTEKATMSLDQAISLLVMHRNNHAKYPLQEVSEARRIVLESGHLAQWVQDEGGNWDLEVRKHSEIKN